MFVLETSLPPHSPCSFPRGRWVCPWGSGRAEQSAFSPGHACPLQWTRSFQPAGAPAAQARREWFLLSCQRRCRMCPEALLAPLRGEPGVKGGVGRRIPHIGSPALGLSSQGRWVGFGGIPVSVYAEGREGSRTDFEGGADKLVALRLCSICSVSCTAVYLRSRGKSLDFPHGPPVTGGDRHAAEHVCVGPRRWWCAPCREPPVQWTRR